MQLNILAHTSFKFIQPKKFSIILFSLIIAFSSLFWMAIVFSTSIFQTIIFMVSKRYLEMLILYVIDINSFESRCKFSLKTLLPEKFKCLFQLSMSPRIISRSMAHTHTVNRWWQCNNFCKHNHTMSTSTS